MKRAWIVLSLLAIAAPACDHRAPIGNSLEVVAVAPANGAGLGPAGTTHPAFRWRAGVGAAFFQLQIDDSCTAPATCAFPAPEIDERALAAVSYLPAAELPYQASAPVGTRYYWRVRACATADVCGAWSPVRYVVAGRTAGALNTDLNGDGYADLVISAPDSSAVVEMGGQLFVYLGGPTLSSAPAIVINSTEIFDGLGATVAMVGDVNGDGYGDFLARTIGNVSTPSRVPTPRALLYFGGVTLDAEPAAIFTGGGVEVENMAAAGLGDVNGDGYDDFAFAGVNWAADRSVILPGWVQVHLGGPSFADVADLTLTGDTQDLFGFAMAGGGDVNGDGFPDLVVGGYQAPGDRASVYFGGPAMNDVADLILAPPTSADVGFGNAVAIAGDVNGDGFDDIVVGARGGDAYPVGPPGRVHLYFGGQAMPTVPDVTFASNIDAELFGTIVAPAGDVNGDGFADIAVVARGVYNFSGATAQRAATGRRVDLFFGGATVDVEPDVTMAAGTSHGYARGFAATDLDGDTKPDFVVGRWITDYQGMGEVAIHRGSTGYATPSLILSGSAPRDAFGAKIGR